MTEDDQCTAIVCNDEATMTLDLTIKYGDGDTHEQEIPYCDEHIGWFFRSFSRASYNVEVRGITVIKDLDVEFGMISGG